MNKSIQSIKKFLTECADGGEVSPGTFHRNIKRRYKRINGGSFRTAYDAGKFVVKIVNVDNDSGWDDDEFEGANRIEVEKYEQFLEYAPNLSYFVLMPVLVEVPGFDAVVMRKVSVCATDRDFKTYSAKHWCSLCEYVRKKFTKKMKDQFFLIQEAFCDTHDNNIGWDFETERVWVIDFNHGDTSDEHEADAARLVKRLTKPVVAKKKAA